jgi:NADH:ubiquinone oxidoreductase subunit 6 (subunit J)
MYVLCSLAQLFIIVTAYLLETRASKIIVFTGIVAVLLNSMEMVLYLSGHPIREAYFIGINIVQTVQIGSLLALSAPGMFLWRLMVRKRQKETPWTHQRAATSGIQ